jgi:hypothetical protein
MRWGYPDDGSGQDSAGSAAPGSLCVSLPGGVKHLVVVSRLGSEVDIPTLDSRRRERTAPKARDGPLASVSVNPGG